MRRVDVTSCLSNALFGLLTLACFFAPRSLPAAPAGKIDELARRLAADVQSFKTRSQAAPLIALGELHLRQGRLKQAIRSFQDAAKTYEGLRRREARFQLGRAYGLAREETLAREIFRKLQEEAPDDPLSDDAAFEDALLDGRELLSPASFLEKFEAFALQDPLALDLDAFHFFCGYMGGFRLDRVGKAVHGFEELLRRHPKSDRLAEALVRLGLIEGFLLGLPEKGLSHFARLRLEHGESEFIDFAALASALLLLGEERFAEAYESLDGVPVEAERGPQIVFLQGLLSAFYLGRPDRALHLFQHMKGPSVPQGWQNLAGVYLSLLHTTYRRDAKAARHALDGIRTEGSPGFLDGWIKSLSGTLSRLEKAKDGPEADLALAQFWRFNGHYRTARKLFDRLAASKTDPEVAQRAGFLRALISDEDVAGERDVRSLWQGVKGRNVLPELEREIDWRLASEKDPATGRPRERALEAVARSGSPFRTVARLALSEVVEDRKRPAVIELRGSGVQERDEAVSLLSSMARRAEKEGRNTIALACLDRILPWAPEALDRLSQIAKDRSKRLPDVDVDPETFPAEEALRLALRLAEGGRNDTALTFLARARKARGAVGDRAAYHQARIQLEKGSRNSSALRVGERFLRSGRGTAAERMKIMDLLSERYAKGDEEDRARAELLRNHLASVGYERDSICRRRAEALVKEGRNEEAVELLAKLPPDSRSAASLALEAECLDRLGRLDQRIERLTLLARSFPEEKEGREARNVLRLVALARLEKRLEREGRDETLPRMLAESLKQIGEGLTPATLGSLKPRLEGLIRSLPPELLKERRFLDALLPVTREIMGSPEETARLLRGHLEASGSRDEGLQLDLARALRDAGRPREAFPILEGVQGLLLPDARLLMAEIQERAFGDPSSARELLQELLRNDGAPTRIRGLAARRWAESLGALSGPEGGSAKTVYLEAVRLLPAGAERADLLERLAREQCKTPSERREGAENWRRAAREHVDAARRLDCWVEAAEAFLAARRWADAGKAGSEALAMRPDESHRIRARRALGRSEARLQVQALKRSVNWSDPESSKNFDALERAARLLIDPLEAYEQASALLVQARELFSHRPEVKRLVRLLEVIPRLREARRREKTVATPEGLFDLAVYFETRVDAWDDAAATYRKLLDRGGSGCAYDLARLYLARLSAYHLGRPGECVEVLAPLLEGESARRFECKRLALLALSRSADRLAHLRAASTRKDEAGTRALASMGALAAVELQDGALALEVACELAERKGGAAPATRLLLLAHRSIEAGSALRMPLSGTDALLEKALEIAPQAELRARAHLALAEDALERGEVPEALEELAKARGASEGSAAARRATWLSARIHEGHPEEHRKALDLYRAVASRFPGTFEAALAESRIHRLRMRLASANLESFVDAATPREEFRRQVRRRMGLSEKGERADGDAVMQLYAGRLYARRYEDLPKALEAYRSYLRLGTRPPLLIEARLAEAKILRSLNRPTEALASLEALLTSFPKDAPRARVLFETAEIHQASLANPDEAKKALAEARKLSPSPELLSKIDALTSRIAEAERLAKRPIPEGPELDWAKKELATIRRDFLGRRRKDPEGGLEALNELLAELAAPRVRAFVELQRAQILEERLERYEEALEAYRQVIETPPDRASGARALLRAGALLSSRLDRPREALGTYESFMKKHPSDPNRVKVLLEIAGLKEKQLDDVQGAIDIYRVVADSYPRSEYDQQALLRLADLSRVYFADYLRAIEAYRNIVDRFPYSDAADDALYKVGRIYEVELGDFAQARAEYERLIQLYPQSPFVGLARDGLIRIQDR